MNGLADRLRHVRRRRAALRAAIDVDRAFETWEETCVPSYVHPNRAAAFVSWWRLFAAVDLAARHTTWGPVLDFGASVGELGHLLPERARPYWVVEQEEAAAQLLLRNHPDARRTTLDEAPDGHFAAVFALDSLEHNTDYAELLDRLHPKLARDGVLVLSGPTESALYRFGRRIAGFDAHYHETNIHAIEAESARRYRSLERRSLPPAAPLFRLSAWAP